MTLVSRNELATVWEQIYRQTTVVGTALADGAAGSVAESLEFVWCNQVALFKAHCMDGRAVSAHQACNRRANDFG